MELHEPGSLRTPGGRVDQEVEPLPSAAVDTGTLTVGQLAAGVDSALTTWFSGELWVQGEITSLRRSSADHVYFQLVERDDDSRIRASIDVALFDSARRYVNEQLRSAGNGIRMTDGMQVRIRGRVEFYAANGRMQVRMSGIDPAFTLELQIDERDRVLAALEADALLARNRSTLIPVAPLRVGLATSDGSAAMADFVDELRASGHAWLVVLAHVPVQGRNADRHVASAVTALDHAGVHVIAIVRGGGSRLDLATFDSERIGRAIATASVPVLTGIGHEIDMSVADVVAHTSYKTPTACAAALVDRVRAGEQRAEAAWTEIRAHAPELLRDADRSLRDTATRVARCTATRVEADAVRVSTCWTRAIERARRRLRDADDAPATTMAGVYDRAGRALARHDARLAIVGARVEGADPDRLLQRGWSITRTTTGSVVRDVADLEPGELLSTTVATGTVQSSVVRVAREQPETPIPEDA
jgi:exodeoxyribonuclease VII large subunit